MPSSLEKEINKQISFSNCIIDWNDGKPCFDSIIKTKDQHGKLNIDDNIWICDDQTTYFAYIECLYQIRCLLFHGNLAPKIENERVIKAFYLTLSIIMEKI